MKHIERSILWFFVGWHATELILRIIAGAK
jgi:hypothetical protein